MPDAAPAWSARAPLGDARWRLVRITRRGVGMTLAAALFWIAMAGVAAFAGLDAGGLGLFFVVGAALVYPGGYLFNRVFGGDLTARGSELRGMVGAITVGQLLGTPLIVALLLRDTPLVAFALATMLGVHFLPYGWLYRAPAYYALAVASASAAALVQVAMPLRANVAIPVAMAALYVAAATHVIHQNRREGAASRASR